jgi:hypothetical protein
MDLIYKRDINIFIFNIVSKYHDEWYQTPQILTWISPIVISINIICDIRPDIQGKYLEFLDIHPKVVMTLLV